METKIVIAQLREIQKDKNAWKSNFELVLSCLNSIELQPKAIWMIGEMCFAFPELLNDEIFKQILSFSKSTNVLLRERAICAIGRIGRSNGNVVKLYIDELLLGLKSTEENIRLNTIWASENIATTHPEFFESKMDRFVPCLYDTAERIRMESPEIFRVVGKRRPEYTLPFIDILQKISQTDANRVVRIHAQGALRAMGIK